MLELGRAASELPWYKYPIPLQKHSGMNTLPHVFSMHPWGRHGITHDHMSVCVCAYTNTHKCIATQNLSFICHILQSVMHVTCSSPLVWLELCSFLHIYGNKMVAACLKAIIHTHYFTCILHAYGKLLMLLSMLISIICSYM